MTLRRNFLHLISGIGVLAYGGHQVFGQSSPFKAKVIVVGGGFGGATAAKYLKIFSNGKIDVTLIEPNQHFISCPMSNLVISGDQSITDITFGYEQLVKKYGVHLIHAKVEQIDSQKRVVALSNGKKLNYDRLVLSPGVDFLFEKIAGLDEDAQKVALHAWKAGPQTLALKAQLEAMPDGGVYGISIPLAPYRCPPGPYERATLIANYFKQFKPRSKVLILDANQDVTSKGPLFKKIWATRFKELIEYRGLHQIESVDIKNKTIQFEAQGELKLNIVNILPPMQAGKIAVDTGLIKPNQRWCEVDFLTFESRVVPNIHVIGDAIQNAQLMPKSGHMANQHGKVCASAVVALLSDHEVNPAPIYNNTCYSFVSKNEAIHVASVHRYDAIQKTMLPVQGAGGLSVEANELEGLYANSWANNIWSDFLA
ncbi:MAG: NAD(P)/FAD-dependent oxidoreductase [Betaproteobacteria bacterium]